MAKIGDTVLYYSRFYNVNPSLIAAVIWQESRCDPNAIRYEDRFFLKYLKRRAYADLGGFLPNPRKVSADTERRMRAVSWGLMQLLGQTAREQGFEGTFLTELLDVEANIKTGVGLLAKFLEQNEGDAHKALLRYNGGGNKMYPHDVLSHIDSTAHQAVFVR